MVEWFCEDVMCGDAGDVGGGVGTGLVGFNPIGYLIGLLRK
jgi:hypothetical protein